MDAFLQQLDYWHWLALGVTLGILDVTLGANFILLWCGLSAVLVSLFVLAFPGLTWEYQFLIFGIGVITSLGIWRKYLKKPVPSDKPYLNQRSSQYIGREFSLEEPIINGRGRVKVDDTLWRVEGEDLPIGTKIKVVDVDGVVLKVIQIPQVKK